MEWISVEKRLPEDEKIVAVICEDGIVAACFTKKYQQTGAWHGVCCCVHEIENPFHVTHWLPLPAPPEKKE